MKNIFVIFLVVILAGCTSAYRSVNQSAGTQAFLELSGDFIGTQLIIDEQQPINVDSNISTYKIDDKTVARFEITVGKHRVKIYRNEQLIVDRVFLVTEGNTFEVYVQ